MNGFGRDGPYAARPAYDAVAQALSGMSSMLIDPEDPRILGPTIADNISAHCACQGILAALFDRARGAPARRVEVNMLEATLAFMPDPFSLLTQTGLVSDAHGRAHASQSFAFACADNKLIAVHLLTIATAAAAAPITVPRLRPILLPPQLLRRGPALIGSAALPTHV